MAVERFIQWYSPVLGIEMKMLAFGHGGKPIILFPTSKGKYYEAKDRKFVQSAQYFIDRGLFTIYCPDSIDEFSWYNWGVPPGKRAYNHTLYDKMVLQEIVTRAQTETSQHHVIVAGCSFGGYHAVNFGFRHPDIVSTIISLSGAFNILDQVPGYMDDNVYFNNPESYIGKATDPNLWNQKVILGVGEFDICLQQNLNMSKILQMKNLPHWLDIWPKAQHDWPIWNEKFPYYLNLLS